MDPFVVMHALPVEPRAWFLGSAPSTFTSRSRERLVHKVGGLLPVWRGGVTIDQHVASARAVVGNGAVFVQMPEGTVSGPAGTTGPFRIGWAVICGPLHRSCRSRCRHRGAVHRPADGVAGAPPRTVADFLPDWDGVVPAPGSREELDLARRMTAALENELRPVVEALHPGTVDPPERRRWLRKRLAWLLLRPGRLDRA